jgi:hypothetical protein
MFAKTTKTIVGALVLTSVSFAITAGAYSAPRHTPPQAQQWMDRAANGADYRGSAGDTNGVGN